MEYSSMNIFIALVGVVVWSEKNEINVTSSGHETLQNFASYRSDVLLKDHPNDSAHLITGMALSDIYGIAKMDAMCSPRRSCGVEKFSSIVGITASTLAHEMAHNFGVNHDDDTCNCDDCIMVSAGHADALGWSSCSYEFFAVYLAQDLDYCLHNKPQKLFGEAQCGNGFVEEGEQCDCGLGAYCDNPCCDSSSCQLRNGATCATGRCCDLQRCDVKPAGARCRTAGSECDLPEFCTGESEFCPDDVFKMDGEECDNAQAFCYRGMCRTHDSQCQLLWGPSGSSAPEVCYNGNVKGTLYGHCGRDGATFKTCDSSDTACGLLHCIHADDNPQSAVPWDAVRRSHSLPQMNACESIMMLVAEGEVDPGLVPDGARCGDGKMCINQTCVPAVKVRNCSSNCSGRGVCTNLGFCHCDDGYAPPDCYYVATQVSSDRATEFSTPGSRNFGSGATDSSTSTAERYTTTESTTYNFRATTNRRTTQKVYTTKKSNSFVPAASTSGRYTTNGYPTESHIFEFGNSFDNPRDDLDSQHANNSIGHFRFPKLIFFVAVIIIGLAGALLLLKFCITGSPASQQRELQVHQYISHTSSNVDQGSCSTLPEGDGLCREQRPNASGHGLT